MERAETPSFFSTKRVLLAVLAVAALAAAFFTASSLTGPGSAPSTLEQDIKEMEVAVQAAPNDLAVRLSLADSYLRAGRLEEALVQYQQALVIDAESQEALLGAGMAHRKLGQPDPAVQAFTTLIALNQDNPYIQINRAVQAAHYYLGQIYREQGKLDESLNELRLALSLNRADADTLFEMGLTFQARGENADAASAYEVALAYVPDFIEAYQGLAEAARAGGDEAKAAYADAMILVLRGKEKDGVRRLEALAQESEDSRVWWGLGYANERLERLDEARMAYRKAVELNPGELMAADALARLEESE